jgi:hypothetical protein
MFFDIYTTYIVPACLLIPLVMALVRYKYLTEPHKWLFCYVLFSVSANVVNIITLELLHKTTMMVNHLYTIFEFIFLSLFYSCFYTGRSKQIIYAVIVFFEIFCIINASVIQHNAFNSYTHTLSAFIYIIYCIIFISKQSADDTDTNWASNSLNWVNTGILVYYGSNILMFAANNYLLTARRNIYDIIWLIHDTIFLIQFILFAIAFYKCRPRQTISTS